MKTNSNFQRGLPSSGKLHVSTKSAEQRAHEREIKDVRTFLRRQGYSKPVSTFLAKRFVEQANAKPGPTV